MNKPDIKGNVKLDCDARKRILQRISTYNGICKAARCSPTDPVFPPEPSEERSRSEMTQKFKKNLERYNRLRKNDPDQDDHPRKPDSVTVPTEEVSDAIKDYKKCQSLIADPLPNLIPEAIPVETPQQRLQKRILQYERLRKGSIVDSTKEETRKDNRISGKELPVEIKQSPLLDRISAYHRKLKTKKEEQNVDVFTLVEERLSRITFLKQRIAEYHSRLKIQNDPVGDGKIVNSHISESLVQENLPVVGNIRSQSTDNSLILIEGVKDTEPLDRLLVLRQKVASYDRIRKSEAVAHTVEEEIHHQTNPSKLHPKGHLSTEEMLNQVPRHPTTSDYHDNSQVNVQTLLVEYLPNYSHVQTNEEVKDMKPQSQTVDRLQILRQKVANYDRKRRSGYIAHLGGNSKETKYPGDHKQPVQLHNSQLDAHLQEAVQFNLSTDYSQMDVSQEIKAIEPKSQPVDRLLLLRQRIAKYDRKRKSAHLDENQLKIQTDLSTPVFDHDYNESVLDEFLIKVGRNGIYRLEIVPNDGEFL